MAITLGFDSDISPCFKMSKIPPYSMSSGLTLYIFAMQRMADFRTYGSSFFRDSLIGSKRYSFSCFTRKHPIDLKASALTKGEP